MNQDLPGAKNTILEVLNYFVDLLAEEPPRRNAFRILGAGVYATSQEIMRQERVLSIARLKPGGGATTPMPLAQRPGRNAVSLAVHRLRSPVSRLLEELFWFWPGLGLEGLEQHPQQVIGQWVDAEKGGDWQAMHSLAVFYLTKAIDLECEEMAGSPLSPRQVEVCTRCWERGARRWQKLATVDEFWRHFSQRVILFNDPRFPVTAVDSLRSALDAVLLRALISLLIKAKYCGRNGQARRSLRLVRNIGFETQLIHSTSRQMLEPVKNELEVMAESARTSTTDSVAVTTQKIADLLAAAQPAMNLFVALLPGKDLLTCAISDTVCNALLSMQIDVTEQVGDWAAALKLLRSARALAHSTEMQQRLDENQITVENNLRQINS